MKRLNLLMSTVVLATAVVATPAMAQTKVAKAGKASTPAVGPLIDQALAGAHRSEANRARDIYRHPKETLEFFGLKPDMTVVEVSPSGGWYTEVIAPVLKDHGRYIAAHVPPVNARSIQSRQDFIDRLKASPEVYGHVAVTSFGRGVETNMAAPNSADMVLTFRNVHNWSMGGNVEAAFQAMYQALKPGGILGVVDHRLPEDRPETPQTRNSGYMKQSEVIRLAEAAGFKLDAVSEINANPKDTADYEKGVWTLPPRLANGETDRAKYQAIGESDRMTLRFVKPAQ